MLMVQKLNGLRSEMATIPPYRHNMSSVEEPLVEVYLVCTRRLTSNRQLHTARSAFSRKIFSHALNNKVARILKAIHAEQDRFHALFKAKQCVTIRGVIRKKAAALNPST
jgi:hypothetical protein